MIVVSNTSPLINLARIGHLELLRQLYTEILIPAAVWQETVVDGSGQAGAEEIRSADWIKNDNPELARGSLPTGETNR